MSNRAYTNPSIHAENLSSQRRALLAKAKHYAQGLSSQPSQWQEKAFLAYLREYVHPQATWADARLIAGKISFSPFDRLAGIKHQLPLNLIANFQDKSQQGFDWLNPTTPWLFHKNRLLDGHWEMPQIAAQYLVEGMEQLGNDNSTSLFPFASGFDKPWLEATRANHPVYSLSATWADAYALSLLLDKGKDRQYWANAFCLPLEIQTSPSIFEANHIWQEALEKFPSIDFGWICLHVRPWAWERFERGNQRLLEMSPPASTLALKQLRWAMLRARDKANLLAIMPTDFLYSPEWIDWRREIDESFEQVLVVELAAMDGYACYCLQKAVVNGGALLYAQQGQSWTRMEWEGISRHQQGEWFLDRHQEFWNGLSLLPLSLPPKKAEKFSIFDKAYKLKPSPLWLSGLHKEEALRRLEVWQEEREEETSDEVQLRYVHPLIKRWVVVSEVLPEGAGLYWAQPQEVQALDAPPVLPLVGNEQEAWWLPMSALSKEALAYFQEYYRKQVPLPKGAITEDLQEIIDAIGKFSQQLPVLQKFTNQLNDLLASQKTFVPYAVFPQLREVLLRYEQKIGLLYQSARERKSLFERLATLLKQLEGYLQSSESAYEQAEALRAAVNPENIGYYIYAVLKEDSYQNHYLPRIPLRADFWAYAEQGRLLWQRNTEANALEISMDESVEPSLPILQLNKEKGLLYVDAQCRISGFGADFFVEGSEEAEAVYRLLEVFKKRYLRLESPDEWPPYQAQLLDAIQHLPISLH